MRLILKLLLPVILILPIGTFAADKLVFAVDLIRHGDRTPISFMPAYQDFWKEGAGQLTAKGMQQEYSLGAKMRKRYVDEAQLLPKTYRHGIMYVRSTDVERTLMSAQSFLMGLYPQGTGPHTRDNDSPGLPQAYQPIPIHTAPVYMDNIIIGKVDADEQRSLYNKYVYSTQEWKDKEAELKPFYKRWSSISGFTIDKLYDVETLADTLFIHVQHHAPIPDELTEDDISTIIKAGDWAFMTSKKPRPIGEAHSHQLVGYIAKKLDRAIKSPSSLKYILLSAHDSTIATTLSALGAPLSTSPPYASDLNFSLYQRSANDYYIKITYNDSVITLPECHGEKCTLAQFIRAAKASQTT